MYHMDLVVMVGELFVEPPEGTVGQNTSVLLSRIEKYATLVRCRDVDHTHTT